MLKHELTHSFIHSITRGQCPRWLNEGLAMIMEPKSSAPYGQALARLFAAGKQAPLASLEGSFTKFSSEQATLAYVESLAATEYLRSNYGMRAVQHMLQLISDGESGEAALRAATHSGYQQFEEDLGVYLAKNGAQ